MAGDWIKMRAELMTSPKLMAMAKHLEGDGFAAWLLGAPPAGGDGASAEHNARYGALRNADVTRRNARYVCVTGLLLVWSLANLHSRDGLCRGMTVDDVDEWAGVPHFGRAMLAVGWLVETAEGVSFPNFDEHNRPAASRFGGKSPAQRQREYRERKKAQEQGAPGAAQPAPQDDAARDGALRDGDVTRVTSRNVTVTAEKRREEKRREEDIPPNPPSDTSVTEAAAAPASGEATPPAGRHSSLPCDNPEHFVDAKKLGTAYRELVNPTIGFRDDQAVIEQLRAGHSPDTLLACIRAYARYCQDNDIEPRFRNGPRKFFAGGMFRDFLPDARLKLPDEDDPVKRALREAALTQQYCRRFRNPQPAEVVASA